MPLINNNEDIMGLNNFEIVFDNSLKTYYCGQQVTGRILLSLDATKNIRGIVIKFKGEASVEFQHTVSSRDRDGKHVQKRVAHTSNEKYFENKYNLLGSATGEILLPAGEHVYPFQTVLPQNLPSSFEGKYGFVRYTVKVTVDRPWRFDHEVKAAFTVISPLDLNLHQTARDPIQRTQEKYFCCCCFCCNPGPLTMVVSVLASGYVSGQQIPITVEVDNISQQKVYSVTCQLRKNVLFHARSPQMATKSDKTIVGSLYFGSVEKNSSATWTEIFTVPPLPPSNLTNCHVIDLEYDLKIEGKVSGCHGNIEIKCPIILGTIPLVNHQPPANTLSDHTGDFVDSHGMYIPTAPLAEGWNLPNLDAGTTQYPSHPPEGYSQPPSYASLPPPSYEEATSGAKNIQDDGDNKFVQGDKEFTPRYPVYYRYQMPTAPTE